ncbi:MAG: cytochrome b/b6 domain-containing protein [Motiliproteus sp.]
MTPSDPLHPDPLQPDLLPPSPIPFNSLSPGDSPTHEMVWDPFVRIFHWSLVAFVVLAYITEDDWLTLHSFAGYAITGLLLFRICWGLIGSRYARFSSFVAKPSSVIDYLKSLFGGHPKHFTGHNPAGGAMVFLLLMMLLLIVFTGMATLATEGSGPLASTFFAQFSEDVLEDIHEALADFLMLLILLHIGGVIVSSFIHRENLVRAMLDGRKKVHSEKSS